MVHDYEEYIIAPPLEFRDNYKPIPKPRTIKSKNQFLLQELKSHLLNKL